MTTSFAKLLVLPIALLALSYAVPAHAAPPSDLATPFSLEETPDGLRMRVRIFAPENGCSWGDLDAIQLELQHSKTKRLLVSLEPLAGSAAPNVTDITAFDLEKGFVTTFLLPKGAKSSHLAFYICKDSERKNRCGAKPAIPPQTVLQSYLTPMDAAGKLGEAPKEPEDATDKIYYFAYILVEGKTGYALKNRMTPGDYDRLGAYLQSTGAAPGLAKSIREKNDTMDSVQPQALDDTISLGLPRIEKAACKRPS